MSKQGAEGKDRVFSFLNKARYYLYVKKWKKKPLRVRNDYYRTDIFELGYYKRKRGKKKI